MIRNKAWACLFGAVLVAVLTMGAAPELYSAGRAAPQTSAHASTKKKKGKSSKSKRPAKPIGQKTPAADRIKDIQTALQREGAYEGEPSGKWDDSTVNAMKNYQDKNGLTPTGKIDAPTLNKLGLGSSTAGKGAPLPTASSMSASPVR